MGTLSRRLLAVGTAVLALYVILLTGQRALDAFRVQQEVEAVRREIAVLRERNLALQAELSSGRLDEEIERIARDELGLIRPGDHPVTLRWPASPPSPPEARRPIVEPEPNWMSWLRLFVDVAPEVR